MNVVLRQSAFNALNSTAQWIEDRNTPGSGDRWKNRFISLLQQYAQDGLQYAICKNESLAERQYRCVSIGNWVVVHRMMGNDLIVYHIIYGSMLP